MLNPIQPQPQPQPQSFSNRQQYERFLVAFSCAKAKEVTSGVFGTLAKCVKNLNPKEDPTLVMDVMAELTKVDGEQQDTLLSSALSWT